jgi:hypothetical protein
VKRMHADEVDIDMPLARRLLASQFPQWASLPIELGRNGCMEAFFKGSPRDLQNPALG